jgi:hypothetical protein
MDIPFFFLVWPHRSEAWPDSDQWESCVGQPKKWNTIKAAKLGTIIGLALRPIHLLAEGQLTELEWLTVILVFVAGWHFFAGKVSKIIAVILLGLAVASLLSQGKLADVDMLVWTLGATVGWCSGLVISVVLVCVVRNVFVSRVQGYFAEKRPAGWSERAAPRDRLRCAGEFFLKPESFPFPDSQLSIFFTDRLGGFC